MDNCDELQRELQATKQKLAEANRRFDEAVKTIHLQGQIIKTIKEDGDDDLTFLMESNGSDTIEPRQA